MRNKVCAVIIVDSSMIDATKDRAAVSVLSKAHSTPTSQRMHAHHPLIANTNDLRLSTRGHSSCTSQDPAGEHNNSIAGQICITISILQVQLRLDTSDPEQCQSSTHTTVTNLWLTSQSATQSYTVATWAVSTGNRLDNCLQWRRSAVYYKA